MAQQSRQSLMAVAMRLYGSFAGKTAVADVVPPSLASPVIRRAPTEAPTSLRRSPSVAATLLRRAPTTANGVVRRA